MQKIVLLVCFFLMVSCNEKPDKMMIPEETLVSVLADVHVAEGALLSIDHTQKDSLKSIYYQQIFEIHSVSDTAFAHDMTILKNNPEQMEIIYEQVMKKINEIGESFEEK